MAFFEVSNITKSFGESKILKGIDFELEKGKVLSIIGSSGSGKTTLLRCLNFLETPNTGIIRIDGQEIFDAARAKSMTDEELRSCRLRFGLVFQSFNLFPQYNVLDNVTLAVKLQAKKRPDYKANRSAILKEIEEKSAF